MLTNSGFTTRESEVITQSRKRRRLARYTMMFGYVFSMTILATIINFFMALSDMEIKFMLWHLAMPALALCALVLLVKDKRLRRRLDELMRRLADWYMNKHGGNHGFLIDDFGKTVMLQLHLKTVPEAMRGRSLRETDLSEKNIIVVLIRRAEGDAKPAGADTVLQDGDRIVVYGAQKALLQTFDVHDMEEN